MKPGRKYNRPLGFYLDEQEHEGFIQAYKNSLCRTKSEYARRLLLGKPVTVVYRNRSLDDFIEEAVRIRKALKAVLAMSAMSQTEKEAFKTGLNEIMLELHKIIEKC